MNKNVAIILLIPALLGAQSYTASLTGLVTDPASAPVPAAAVQVVNEETAAAVSTVTDAQGRYAAPGLTPGVYRLRIEHAGFKAYARGGIRLEVDQVARIDVPLELGDLSQRVEVTAEAPLLNTETSSRGQVIGQSEIADFPLESRDWFGLSFLVPGVAPTADGLGEDKNYANVNGSRHREMNFFVDGSGNKSARYGDPSAGMVVDTIREFKVQTSNYSAEFGRMSSGILNAALKSGTNRFSGMLYHYHRNMAFDARNFFDADKSKLIRNQFGGNLGGPVVRDRVFFFASYEGRRARDGAPRIDVVPTAAIRSGDLSGWRYPLIDPLNNRAPFPGNIVPKPRFHPTSEKIQQRYPEPNLAIPLGANNYFNNAVTRRTSENVLAKVDWNPKAGRSFSFRHNDSRSGDVEPFRATTIPGFESTNDGGRHNAGVNYTQMLAPTVLLQVTASYLRANGAVIPVDMSTDYGEALGISGITRDPALFGFPSVVITNYAAIGDRDPVRWTTNDYQISSAASMFRGGHNLRFGGDAVLTQLAELVAAQSRGRFTFRGRWTSLSSSATQQQSYADFLLGLLDQANRRLNPISNFISARTMGAFVQDDWKVKSNLTLNLGLRYEVLLPPTERFDMWTSFIPEAGRVVLSGDPAYPRALVYADKNNFAPRLGFAWRPRGSRVWVVRGGYGVFYGMNLLGEIHGSLGTNPPFTVQENYSRNTADPSLLTWSSPFPGARKSLAGITSPRGFEARPPNAYMQNYNFTIERELNRYTVVEAAYVGSKGTHLGHRWDLNQPLRGPQIPAPFPRPYPAFSTINYFSFDSNSNFHSMQASLRVAHSRLNLRLSYTLGKSIDEGSTFTDAGSGGYTGLQDSRNRSLERGLSDFDRRHAFSLSALHTLPWRPGGGPGWLRAMTEGWQAGGILRLYSGTPLTPRTGTANVDLGEATRPDRIAGGRIDDPSPMRWFDESAFVPVPPGSYRFGNSGRGILTGPGRIMWDCSLLKTFRLTERAKAQFRWEVFNVPNHPNFLTPNLAVDNPSAGVVTRAMPARQMQAALKFLF